VASCSSTPGSPRGPRVRLTQCVLSRASSARAFGLGLMAVAALRCAPPAPHASSADGPAALGSGDAEQPAESTARGYPEFASEHAAYCGAGDVFAMQLAQADDPERTRRTKRFRPSKLARSIRKPFPDASFAVVRGWMFDHEGGPFPSFNSPECAFGALSANGELCSTVRLPGVQLSAEQASELLSKLNAEVVPEPKYCLCGGKTSRMHSFVFYDEHDTPVASVSLNLRFNDLYTSPQNGRKLHQASVSEEFSAWYEGFCERVGLPLCFLWDRERADRFYAELERTRAKCVRESPFGHIPDQPLAQLEQHERRALCAYHHQYVFRRPDGPDGYFGQESPDGEQWIGRTLAWPECEATFPRCKERLSEVMPCQRRAMDGDPGFFAADARACRALSSCLWGSEVKQTPAP